MMTVRILFLGPARDAIGVDATDLQLPIGATVADMRQVLHEQYPTLGSLMEALRVAVNEHYAPDPQHLREGDEIALIPPVSGGEDDEWIDLLPTALPVNEAQAFVGKREEMGGICTFVGATRSERDPLHGRLIGLQYEAYNGMALRCMRDLVGRARRQWPIGAVALLHRAGAVGLGEPSVVIAVACPHRAEAFEACRWLIDTLKQEVPIWKKDVYEDGFTRWVEPKAQAGGREVSPAEARGSPGRR